MPYPLASLLKIRERRYNDSLTNQSQCQQVLAHAVQGTRTTEKKYQDYKVWKEQEIERRYAAIMGLDLPKEKLDLFFSSLTHLDVEEIELEKAWNQAQEDESKARIAYQEAKEHAKKAHQALFKLQKQEELWQCEQARYQEYQAELELEDFRPISRNSDF